MFYSVGLQIWPLSSEGVVKGKPGDIGVFAEKKKKKNVVEHQKINANHTDTQNSPDISS